MSGCTTTSSPLTVEQFRRDRYDPETITLDELQVLSNWSPIVDVVSSSLPHGHESVVRVNDGLFVTSGRQPHGRITELRAGIEAKLGLIFSADELRGCNGIFALPRTSTGELLLLFSLPPLVGPVSTLAMSIGQDSWTMIDEESNPGLNLLRPTIAVDHHEHVLVQVTTVSIAVLHDGKEDQNLHVELEEPGQLVSAADVDARNMFALVAYSPQTTLHSNDSGSSPGLQAFDLRTGTLVLAENINAVGLRAGARITAVTLFEFTAHRFAAVGTAQGSLCVFDIDQSIHATRFKPYTHVMPLGSSTVTAAYESIVVLQSSEEWATERFLIAGGLRNGLLQLLELRLTAEGTPYAPTT